MATKKHFILEKFSVPRYFAVLGNYWAVFCARGVGHTLISSCLADWNDPARWKKTGWMSEFLFPSKLQILSKASNTLYDSDQPREVPPSVHFLGDFPSWGVVVPFIHYTIPLLMTCCLGVDLLIFASSIFEMLDKWRKEFSRQLINLHNIRCFFSMHKPNVAELICMTVTFLKQSSQCKHPDSVRVRISTILMHVKGLLFS